MSDIKIFENKEFGEIRKEANFDIIFGEGIKASS